MGYDTSDGKEMKMRYGIVMLGLLAMSCADAGNEVNQDTGAKAVSLTRVTILDQNGTVLKSITDEKLLNEISEFWRGKIPTGGNIALSDDYTIQLDCSDGSASTWYYDARGYVRKSSQRDSSIYNIVGNRRLLEIISP